MNQYCSSSTLSHVRVLVPFGIKILILIPCLESWTVAGEGGKGKGNLDRMAAVVAFMYARKRAGIKAEAEEREQKVKDWNNQMGMQGSTISIEEAAARGVIASKLGRAWRKRGSVAHLSSQTAPSEHTVPPLAAVKRVTSPG